MKSYFTFHRPASAQRYHSERMWREGDFCSPFTSHAIGRPNAVARQHVCEALTWGELKRWTCTATADLREYGRIGYDQVMMWLPNRIERRLQGLIVRADHNIHPSRRFLSYLIVAMWTANVCGTGFAG